MNAARFALGDVACGIETAITGISCGSELNITILQTCYQGAISACCAIGAELQTTCSQLTSRAWDAAASRPHKAWLAKTHQILALAGTGAIQCVGVT